MNNNTSTPQSVTLQTAVLMTIKEFAKQLTPFSAHEITKQIRQAVSDATLEIPETEVHGASYRFDIPHTKVKDLFAELWRNGLFDSEFSLSRKFNGMYYEYTPSPVQSAVQSASTSVPQAPTTSVPVVQVLSSSNGKVNKADVTSRIAKYLENCKGRNFRPTLKQVQSAIKRNDESSGWKCEDIKTIITDDLKYAIILNPDCESSAQVTTVKF